MSIKEKLDYIRQNKRIVKDSLKFYNVMCKDCQRKVWLKRNTNTRVEGIHERQGLNFDKYCINCQKKANKIFYYIGKKDDNPP